MNLENAHFTAILRSQF